MPITYDAAHWRDKAEKARMLATQTEDPLSRIVLKQLALDYDRLAHSIERYKRAEAAALARKHI